jgi:hypothetical protein
VAVDIELDRTTADLAILDGGKCAGGSVNNRGKDRSAVGAHNARLYFEVHILNVSTNGARITDFFGK